MYQSKMPALKRAQRIAGAIAIRMKIELRKPYLYIEWLLRCVRSRYIRIYAVLKRRSVQIAMDCVGLLRYWDGRWYALLLFTIWCCSSYAAYYLFITVRGCSEHLTPLLGVALAILIWSKNRITRSIADEPNGGLYISHHKNAIYSFFRELINFYRYLRILAHPFRCYVDIIEGHDVPEHAIPEKRQKILLQRRSLIDVIKIRAGYPNLGLRIRKDSNAFYFWLEGSWREAGDEQSAERALLNDFGIIPPDHGRPLLCTLRIYRIHAWRDSGEGELEVHRVCYTRGKFQLLKSNSLWISPPSDWEFAD